MALFGKKKDADAGKASKEVKVAKAKKPKEAKPVAAKKEQKDIPVSARDLSHVLRRPRITEKAAYVEGGVYVFEVSERATKRDVREAVKLYYKAEPVRINIAKIPSKRVFVRGKWGVKSGGKKAYVYLKKGETIEIV